MNKETFKQIFKELLEDGDIALYVEREVDYDSISIKTEVHIDGEKVYESKQRL
ncbi:hypothetical protein [Bacillus gaemokensis]|uniref:hypothetical protein n=1 Tax=Bacillus gaemokensis TaxID=574375 RepID=UPI000A8BDDC4|nr:hypothetical protein [Bacillus gaemokensis]